MAYCAELSLTEDAQDECLGDLEDALFAANLDKARASASLDFGLRKLSGVRKPCAWYDLRCRAAARELDLEAAR